jgi:hypothetical protein
MSEQKTGNGKETMSRHHLCAAAAATVLSATVFGVSAPVHAQSAWPTQPVHIILSVPPGAAQMLPRA